MGLLQYESARDDTSGTTYDPRRRPVWVYVVVGLYALLAAGIVGLGTAVPFLNNGQIDSEVRFVILIVCVLILCGASLIMVPVRAARRRPVTRRSLWIPLLGSAVLAGGLAFGAAISLMEYADVNEAWPALLAVGGVWGAWTLLFWVLSWERGPERIVRVLHRWLLAGSVLELLVAVPTHVIVRRRDECCAGIATGIGICIGIAVMIVAFGPSVALLYYRRWKQITPRTTQATSAGASVPPDLQ